MTIEKISLVGLPMDLGQTRRGVDMGPSAIRYAGIVDRLKSLKIDVEDLGDIVISRLTSSSQFRFSLKKLISLLLKQIHKLAAKVDEIVQGGSFPLVLGGDHSIAIGTLAGVSKHYQNLGVIWFDAHGDLNTEETSPSGNIHGMPLAVSLGIGHPDLVNIHGYAPKVKPEHVVIIGARSLDEGEKKLIKEKGIKVYTMHEIDRLGMTTGNGGVHFLFKRTNGWSAFIFRFRWFRSSDAPGVGTPVIGGISYRESHLAMEMLEEAQFITSAEFVEVNPILDERNKTAEIAVELSRFVIWRKAFIEFDFIIKE